MVALKDRRQQRDTTRRLIKNYFDELNESQRSEIRMLRFISKRFWTITNMSDRNLESLRELQHLRFNEVEFKNKHKKSQLMFNQLLMNKRKRKSMMQLRSHSSGSSYPLMRVQRF